MDNKLYALVNIPSETTDHYEICATIERNVVGVYTSPDEALKNAERFYLTKTKHRITKFYLVPNLQHKGYWYIDMCKRVGSQLTYQTIFGVRELFVNAPAI